jgi:2-iminobutanoate/2-iminopropanoate deaminase
MSLWNNVNDIFKCFFEIHKPARTIVNVKEVHYGFKIAIEAIAEKTC